MTPEQPDHSWSRAGRAFFRLDTATDCAVVSIGGEVDMLTASALQDVLEQALLHSAHLIVDLTHADFLDSSALGVLIRARRRTHDAGGSLFLVRPPEIVRKVLAGSRLQQTFPVYDSLSEAAGVARAVERPLAAPGA